LCGEVRDSAERVTERETDIEFGQPEEWSRYTRRWRGLERSKILDVFWVVVII